MRNLLRALAWFFAASLWASSVAGQPAQSTAAASKPLTSGPAPRPASGPAHTAPVKLVVDINETIARVPVSLRLPGGRPHSGEMLVTHYRPLGQGPFPVVVFSHGRNSQTRHEPARWRALPTARYWVRRGFAVLVLTRVGYGELGQDVDPETGGGCENADYGPALDAMSAQVEKAVEFAATLPWADTGRIVLQGVSYGGFGTIAASAKSIPGVVGAINFVGGLGGNPQHRPRNPCQGERISKIAATAGEKTKVPMLWLYVENDLFWGTEWPKRWHKAFTDAGGKAKLTTFGPIGDDGHKLLNEGFAHWRPAVDQFVGSLGFKLPVAATSLKASNFARLDEGGKLPHVKPAAKTEGYAKFLAADVPRAFAISPSGAWAWRSGKDAVEVALSRCQSQSQSQCFLYAVDDRVVWKAGQK